LNHPTLPTSVQQQQKHRPQHTLEWSPVSTEALQRGSDQGRWFAPLFQLLGNLEVVKFKIIALNTALWLYALKHNLEVVKFKIIALNMALWLYALKHNLEVVTFKIIALNMA